MAFPIPLVAPVRIAVFPESEKRDDDMGESQLVIDVMQNISEMVRAGNTGSAVKLNFDRIVRRYIGLCMRKWLRNGWNEVLFTT
jgi:hypothetical protein